MDVGNLDLYKEESYNLMINRFFFGGIFFFYLNKLYFDVFDVFVIYMYFDFVERLFFEEIC